MSKKTLLLQPIQGKFVQCLVGGHTTKIWLVNPDTNEQGTEVSYEDGIKLLALPHPVVTVAQVKGKDGNYIVQLDDDDKALIAEKRREFLSGEVSTSSKGSDDSALKQLADTQAKLIEAQTAQIQNQNTQIQNMQNDIAEMKAMFAEMQKNSKKTSKKEKEESAK